MMELVAGVTDALTQTHNRVAVDASQPLGGADGIAFGEQRNSTNLLRKGQGVHSGLVLLLSIQKHIIIYNMLIIFDFLLSLL